MNFYGVCVTQKGRRLIAKLVAGETLSITKVMVGKGVCDSDQTDPRTLTELVDPVAKGTSNMPTYDGETVHMVVEYRSDLNGGLQTGFWLSEFGIYANDPDDGEVMIYYACLGDYPQWVSAMKGTGVDVRRFPVNIIIGEGTGVTVEYNCEAWVTVEEMEQYVRDTVLPGMDENIAEKLEEHNQDPNAHGDVLKKAAYEAAKANGYTGSEDDFYKALAAILQYKQIQEGNKQDLENQKGTAFFDVAAGVVPGYNDDLGIAQFSSGNDTFQVSVYNGHLIFRQKDDPSGSWGAFQEVMNKSDAATAAGKLSTPRNINGMLFDGTEDRTNYGVCRTPAETAAKVMDCKGFALATGAEVAVKFTATNTALNPTLNVNGTGPKPIYYQGAAVPAATLAGNQILMFRYNGQQYELVAGGASAGGGGGGGGTTSGIVVQPEAPGDTKLFWIDTSQGGVFKYHDSGSNSWKAIKSVWG